MTHLECRECGAHTFTSRVASTVTAEGMILAPKHLDVVATARRLECDQCLHTGEVAPCEHQDVRLPEAVIDGDVATLRFECNACQGYFETTIPLDAHDWMRLV